MPYSYATDPAFKRRFKRKPKGDQDAILECIERLIADPHHPGLRTKRLQVGKEAVFSARVNRDSRLTFHWEGSTIVLRNHCHHDATLRRP